MLRASRAPSKAAVSSLFHCTSALFQTTAISFKPMLAPKSLPVFSIPQYQLQTTYSSSSSSSSQQTTSFCLPKKRTAFKRLAAATAIGGGVLLYTKVKKEHKEQEAEAILAIDRSLEEKSEKSIDRKKIYAISNFLVIAMGVIACFTKSFLLIALTCLWHIGVMLYRLYAKKPFETTVYKTLRLAEKKHPELVFNKGGCCSGLVLMDYIYYCAGKNLESALSDIQTSLIENRELTKDQYALLEDIASVQHDSRGIYITNKMLFHPDRNSPDFQLLHKIYKYLLEYELVDLTSLDSYDALTHIALKRAITNPGKLIPVHISSSPKEYRTFYLGHICGIIYDNKQIKFFDGNSSFSTSDMAVAKKLCSNQIRIINDFVKRSEGCNLMIGYVDFPHETQFIEDVLGENRSNSSLFFYNKTRREQEKRDDIAAMVRLSCAS